MKCLQPSAAANPSRSHARVQRLFGNQENRGPSPILPPSRRLRRGRPLLCFHWKGSGECPFCLKAVLQASARIELIGHRHRKLVVRNGVWRHREWLRSLKPFESLLIEDGETRSFDD